MYHNYTLSLIKRCFYKALQFLRLLSTNNCGDLFTCLAAQCIMVNVTISQCSAGLLLRTIIKIIILMVQASKI